MKITTKSKESIIPNGTVWIHTRGEVKKQKVYCPILVVATNKSLTFYEVSVKSFYLVSLSSSLPHPQIKSIKLNVSQLWCNHLNQLVIASETGSGRVYVYTVRELVVTVLFRLPLDARDSSPCR